MTKENKNSLCYWYPKIKDLKIPQPRTFIVELTKEDHRALFNTLDGGNMEGLESLLTSLEKYASVLGFPVFLRTDQASGKHDWENTCFISSPDRLPGNLWRVIEFNINAGVFGLPYQAIVLREFLELETSFKAFYGNMPIAKERRYFIQDGKVQCHHRYWPEDAILSGSPRDLLPPDWKEKLQHLNYESPEEIKCLTKYAERVGGVLSGYWSIDFAKGRTGLWYLIDMAQGNESWHEESCEYSLFKREKKEKPLLEDLFKKIDANFSSELGEKPDDQNKRKTKLLE